MPVTRKVLWAIVAYVITGFVVIEICYYAILCRPFTQYWAVPVHNPQCATYTHYSIIQMVFNLSSDIMIIFLPGAILWRSSLPWKRKIALIGLFALGFFTIACAVANKSVHVSKFREQTLKSLQGFQLHESGYHGICSLVH
jgi:hypothetical protein